MGRQVFQQRGLADTRRTTDHQALALPLPRRGEHAVQPGKLVGTADDLRRDPGSRLWYVIALWCALRLRHGQARVASEDGQLKALQILAWVQAQFLGQTLPGAPVNGQCFRLAAAPVQREHQLLHQPLPLRMLDDQASQRVQQIPVVAETQPRLDQVFLRHEPGLFQAGDEPLLCLRLGGASQGSSDPQVQRALKQRSARDIVRNGPRLRDKRTEKVHVNGHRVGDHRVPRSPGLDTHAGQFGKGRAKCRYTDPNRMTGGPWRPSGPGEVHDPCHLNVPVNLQRQDGQDQPLLTWPELDAPVVGMDLHGTQQLQADFHAAF